MRRIVLLLFISATFLVSSCKWLYLHQDICDFYVYNMSDDQIVFFFPTNGTYPVTGYPMRMYPDTAITFSSLFLRGPVSPDTYYEVDGILVKEIYQLRKLDTLSLFVFDSFYKESREWVSTGNGDGHFVNEAWDDAIEEYDVLARYDLSYEDMERLRNDDGIVRVYYPPTYEMEDIKMYLPNKRDASQR